MRVFGLGLWLLSLPLLASSEMTTQIFDIDYGTHRGDVVLVLLQNGQVAKLAHSAAEFDFSEKEELRKRWFRLSLDRYRFITKITPVPPPSRRAPQWCLKGRAQSVYVPTTIKDMATARSYFREARYNPKESQCFNRAMVWTFEWWKRHSLRANKILIYFTRSYIRRYNFEWWFHIAPLVHVLENDRVVERVMDRKYTSGPLELVKWANIFLQRDPPCPIITKFSDYADHPYSGDCFLQRTHMYTYQPADLQMYEAWGYQKENFNMNEVRQAYLEAFDEQP